MRPYLRSANVTWAGIDLTDVKEMNFDPGEAATFELHTGDLLLNEASGSPNEVGKPAIWNGAIEGCCFQNTLLRVLSKGPATAFLYWYCRSMALAGSFGAAGRGVNIRHLGKNGLASFPLPLAPLREQERIVAAIEEHLSRADAGNAALDSAEIRLESMRSSVLEDAVRCDWPCRPLGEVLLSLRNGCFVSRPRAEPPGLPILRISALRPLALDASDVRFAPEALSRAADYKLKQDDILFTRYSGNPDYVGACATVPAEGVGLLHPDKLIRGVPDTSIVLGDWIAMAVSASAGRHEIEQRLKTTAGQVGIAGSQLRTVPIPLPPLDEQAARIERWKRGSDAIIRLRTQVEGSRQRSGLVRRSVLTAAFRGALLPQDPNDEPASALLERIRAGRGSAASAKPRRQAARS